MSQTVNSRKGAVKLPALHNMKLFLKLLAWTTGITVFIFILAASAFWYFLYSTADDMCSNKIINSIDLNHSQLKAVIFQRDCGATTGFSTQVSLLKTDNTLPNEGGNIFVADTDHGKAPSGEGGGPEVKIKLISRDHLIIFTHPKARIFKNKNSWNNITISYQDL